MNRRTLLIGGTAALTASIAAGGLLTRPAQAAEPTFLRNGLAIGGTDPVAYFTHARPMPGNPALTHDHAGATWRFMNEMTRDAFAADPEMYAPQYGGFCAWAIAAQGTLVSTDPDSWAIENDRLFLTHDTATKSKWDANRAGFIQQADLRWPRIIAAA